MMPAIVLENAQRIYHGYGSYIRFNPTKLMNDHSISLTTKKITWADLIIFPQTHQDLLPVYREIKAINPLCKSAFILEYDYLSIDETHPYYNVLAPKAVKETLRNNILAADKVLTPNHNMIEKFKKVIERDYRFMPTLFNPEYFSPPQERPEAKERRVGIISTPFNWGDINSVKRELTEAQKMYPDLTFVVIGNSPVHTSTSKNALAGVKYEMVKPSPILEFDDALIASNLDALLIPLKETEHNMVTEWPSKLLLANACNIPVIAPANMYPYNFMVNKEIGLPYSEKKDIVEAIKFVCTENPSIRMMGIKARNVITQKYTLKGENLNEQYNLWA
jgi:glycosyltransferase involved in cell wall biosynthesis